MNQLLTNIAIVLLVATALFQASYVLLFRRQLRKPDIRGKNSFKPKTAIVLCLRGVDPDLDDCLAGIANQAFENFELHIVMDHASDPSRPVVMKFIKRIEENAFPVHLHTLERIESTGSLKCQSLVFVIEHLAHDTEVVAFIDADAIVDEQWLARLVGPLADPTIGASTGIRWFTPPDDRLGSWVREIWNAAAIVQMQHYRIAWGGSLAIKKSVFEETDLLARWRTTLCEDTMLSSELRRFGLRVHRVASVVVNNCESTSLPAAVDWFTRQLLTVRLYHPYWPFVFGHAIAVGLCIFAVPALVLSLIQAGFSKMALTVLIAWVAYQFVNGLLLEAIRVTNRRLLGEDDREVKIQPVKYIWALLQAQMVQPFAACKALLARTVCWRGVAYRIEKDKSVSLINYRPYRDVQTSADGSIQ